MVFLFAMLFLGNQDMDPILKNWAAYAKSHRTIDHAFILQAAIPLEEHEKGFLESAQSVRANKKYLYVRGDHNEPLLCFDRTGKWVRQIGKLGEGPGEYRSVTGIEFAYEGNLALYDSYNSKILLYTPDGNFISQTTHIKNRESICVRGSSFSWPVRHIIYFMNSGSRINDPIIEVYEVKLTKGNTVHLTFLRRIGPRLGFETQGNYKDSGKMIFCKNNFYIGFHFQSEIYKSNSINSATKTILLKNPSNITRIDYFNRLKGTKHEILTTVNLTAVTHNLFPYKNWVIVYQGNLGFNLLNTQSDTFLMKSNLRQEMGLFVGTTENELIISSKFSSLNQKAKELLKKTHPAINESFDNPIILLYTAKPEFVNEWLKKE